MKLSVHFTSFDRPFVRRGNGAGGPETLAIHLSRAHGTVPAGPHQAETAAAFSQALGSAGG